MTLPASGTMRMGADIDVQLGHSASTQISLGGSECRTLSGVASGVIRLGADFYGKPPTVAFDADATASTRGTATTLTNGNLTIGSGVHRALIVQMTTSLATTQTVVWDAAGANQALTLIGSTAYASSYTSWLYGLINPASGNKIVTVTWGGGGSNFGVLNAASFTGVNQTGGATSFPNYTGTSGLGISPSVTVTSATGDMVVDTLMCQTAPIAGNKTKLFWNTGGTVNGGSQYAAGAATVALSWTQGSSYIYALGACSIKAG